MSLCPSAIASTPSTIRRHRLHIIAEIAPPRRRVITRKSAILRDEYVVRALVHATRTGTSPLGPPLRPPRPADGLPLGRNQGCDLVGV